MPVSWCIVACVIGLISGVARGHFIITEPNEYARYFDSHSEILADIVSKPSPSATGLQFVARAVGVDQGIVVHIAPNQDPQYGQRVIVSGTLHAPQVIQDISTSQGGSSAPFNYPGYLLSKGITATLAMPKSYVVMRTPPTLADRFSSFAYSIQAAIDNHIFQRYDSGTLPLLKAVLFGDRSSIDSQDQEAFVRSGTIHLIAVSGFKLSILLLAVRSLLGPFLPKRMMIATILFCSLAYVTVFAFDPPVLRAAAMSAVAMCGELWGGGYQATYTLLVLAALFALHNPAALAFDSSMLFSLLGVLGIIIVGPLLETGVSRLFGGLRIVLLIPSVPKKIVTAFLIPALGAMLCTLPLSFYWYGETSVLMPFSMLLVMPLFEPSIILGYASGLPALGLLSAAANEPLLRYFSWMIQHLSALPFASFHFQCTAAETYLWYGIAVMSYAMYAPLKKQRTSGTIDALPIA